MSLWPANEINTAVLYVDIVGSTKIATSLSSEELSGLIKVFSEEMSVVASKHAGFVLKYAGDAVVAFFPELKKDFGKHGRKCRPLCTFHEYACDSFSESDVW